MKKVKPFKTLDEQISYLQDTKSIIFSDTEKAKQYLLDSNYFNVISCGKVKFAERIEKGCHVYSTHIFEEWQSYFEQDCTVSEYLMMSMIEFERIVNSRVAYFVSELFASDKLTADEKNSLILIIKHSDSRFSGEESWKYITKMTFGETKKLLLWIEKNNKQGFKMIVREYDFLQQNIKRRLDDLNNLRNAIFHFTPLNIFLSYAYRYNGKIDNRSRKEAMKFVISLKPHKDNEKIIDEIIQHSDKFVTLKNSQRKR